jgi:hypothetical protein
MNELEMYRCGARDAAMKQIAESPQAGHMAAASRAAVARI